MTKKIMNSIMGLTSSSLREFEEYLEERNSQYKKREEQPCVEYKQDRCTHMDGDLNCYNYKMRGSVYCRAHRYQRCEGMNCDKTRCKNRMLRGNGDSYCHLHQKSQEEILEEILNELYNLRERVKYLEEQDEIGREGEEWINYEES